jgi:geranylgeranyl transferase type-2 subunit beta
MSPYLQYLTARLAEGVARLPAKVRERHAGYLLGAQNPDGGFSGREGGSDLYYTAFALRGLAVLDALPPEVCRKAAGFLRASLAAHASVIDLFSLLYSCLLVQASGGVDVLADSPADWPDRVAATLETFRTPDGGYAKAAGSASGSTYHLFLVGLCYEMLGRTLPRAQETANFVLSRRREDGGFVELAPMRKSGTNPTAAAVGVLQLLESAGLANAVSAEVRAGVIGFLAAMPSELEGGLRANGRIPAADLLSTFTGCWTLHRLGGLDEIDGEDAFDYARAVEEERGGFRGGLWDDRIDVEYTFYGLGVLGLLYEGPRPGVRLA